MKKAYSRIKPKITLYNGVVYNSATEALWAQSFDFLGWEHAYEARLLGGWNPDFMLTRADGGHVFVEVKPDTGPFWTAVQRKMQECKLDRSKDVLAFCYHLPEFQKEPVLFGRIGLYDTLMGEQWGWTWWDGIVWWADTPVYKWGLAVPDLSKELLLSKEDVAAVGGIVV